MKVEINWELQWFRVTKENQEQLKTLFDLFGYDVGWEWMEEYVKGSWWTGHADVFTKKEILKIIDEYINDNKPRCEGAGTSSSSIPK